MSGKVFQRGCLRYVVRTGYNRQSVKILRWDRDGFILYQKRLERGTFEMPSVNMSTGRTELPWRTFSLIMQGISTKSVKYRKRMNIDS
ncbi:IS66 family insertion sequence element accessory protein TnpB [Hallella multisaccharivorax]|uniref:IS66 family insertion sequence element accessory protein TnpB n=1 Tax=Hallella multisaccharivorax TaxID=310514 RepID=UPI0036067FCF